MNSDANIVAGLDRAIHEPARLAIVTILSAVESADFVYLQRETGLTKGNLSFHLAKLEEVSYVAIEKTYRGRLPLTLVRLTETGETALRDYRKRLKEFLEKSASPRKR